MFYVWKYILKGVRNSPAHKWRKKYVTGHHLTFSFVKKILCAHSNQLASFLDRWVVENTSRYNELSLPHSRTTGLVRSHINQPFLTSFLTHRLWSELTSTNPFLPIFWHTKVVRTHIKNTHITRFEFCDAVKKNETFNSSPVPCIWNSYCSDAHFTN